VQESTRHHAGEAEASRDGALSRRMLGQQAQPLDGGTLILERARVGERAHGGAIFFL
jgi:hypothetical protein